MARFGARAAVVVVLLATIAPAARASGAGLDPSRAAVWLAAQQSASGSFDDGPADAAAEAIASLVAGGVGGEPVARALDFIGKEGPARGRERAAYAARIVLGLHASGNDPAAFGGVDYVALIEEKQDPVTGELDEGIYSHALAVLGLVAGRGRAPDEAVRYLRVNECREGGFGHERGCLTGADTDTTAMAVSALLEAGVDRTDPVAQRARDVLRNTQNPDGGFGLTVGATTNANSTGLAISALVALGEDVAARAWRRADGGPLDALARLQTRAGGFRYLASLDDPNLYATVQAIPGAARATYPIAPRTAIAEPRAQGSLPRASRDPAAREPRVAGVRTHATQPATPSVDGFPAGVFPMQPPRSRAIPIAAGLAILIVLSSAHVIVRWRR